MAIAIKSIPVLTGKEAKSFVEKAAYNYNNNKNTVDFSQQLEKANRILEKSKLK